MARYKNLTYGPVAERPPEIAPGSITMMDSEGRVYHQHPDRVAKRLTQGWFLVDPETLKPIEEKPEPMEAPKPPEVADEKPWPAPKSQGKAKAKKKGKDRGRTG
ncbi:MAG: hypothetical protein GY906_18140 [bacterium]|nr:hypothetical protein [bacterium]